MLTDDIHEALHLVQELNHGSLTRADLLTAGLGPYAIRRAVADHRLRRVHRDAYRLPRPDDDPDADFRTAVVAVRRRQPHRVLTGPAALATHGLPLFGRPSTVHVGCDSRSGSSARSVSGTVFLPPPEQLVDAPGGPVAGVARAVLDTARLLSLTAGVVAADAALRRRLCTPAELEDVVATMTGLPGVGEARSCVVLASEASESPGESWSVVTMYRHGIPLPRRQELFADDDGVIGRVDFWWPERRLVGEFDGKVKYGRDNPSGRAPEQVLWEEKRREDRLRRQVHGVSRWTTADLVAPRSWLQHLRGLLL